MASRVALAVPSSVDLPVVLHLAILILEKRRLTGGEAVLEIVVDEPPTRAGIDPYNKLIDRLSGDNVVAVGAR